MSIFTIDADNHITAYTTTQEASQAGAGLTQFDSQDELTRISTEWPLSRLVDVWNSIPGNGKVNKFQDRKTAVTRVWKALQLWAAHSQTDQPEAQPKAQQPKRAGSSDKPAKSPKLARKRKAAKAADQPASGPINKKAEVIALMRRAKGATLAEVMLCTGWQKHTVRGFVSILASKGGHTIESSKNAAGDRIYRLTN